MSAPSSTPAWFVTIAAVYGAQLATLMTTPVDLSRYDADLGDFAPLATVLAYLTTPKLKTPAPAEGLTLLVGLETDVQIGDRFPYDGWIWQVADRTSYLAAGQAVALELLGSRVVPVGGSATLGGANFIPNAVIDTRRAGSLYLTAIAAEFQTPRPGAVLPEGEPIDYLVLVPMATDIETNDVVVLTAYAGVAIADPDTLLVRARMWQGAAPNALRRLLVRATVIGGR